MTHFIDLLAEGMQERILKSSTNRFLWGGQKKTGECSTTCQIFPQSVRGSV